MTKFFLAVFVLVFSLVGIATANRTWDDGGDPNELWSCPTNWSGDMVPGSGDIVTVGPKNPPWNVTIDSTISADFYDLRQRWSTINMTGGTLDASSSHGWMLIGWGNGDPIGPAVLNLSGGTINAEHMRIGDHRQGTVNMTGGTINIAGQLKICFFDTATGHLQLDGGTVNCGSFSMKTSGVATMDIAAGTMVVDGDETTTIQGYITSGYITSYGGNGTVSIDYNVTNSGKTTAKSNVDRLGYAKDENPVDGETGVAVNTAVTWTSGYYAASHDVYFGTANPPPFIRNQAETIYVPPDNLAGVTTYYWRIDEGDVWSFTTGDPYSASEPYPADDAIGAASGVTLSWTSGYYAALHDVYFGTTKPPPFIRNQAETIYDPPGNLVEGQTYYWRIDEVDNSDTYTGDVWIFTAYDLSAPVWDCNSFTLAFDSAGYVSMLYYKPTGRQLISTTSGNAGFTVFNDGPDERLTKVNRTSTGKLLARSADDSRQVLFDVIGRDKHIAFRIEKLVGLPASENAKLKFGFRPNLTNKREPTALPAWYGEGIGVGAISLDWMTWSYKGFSVKWEYLWHRESLPSDPIGGFALFVCDEDETLNTVGQIELDEPDYLLHPMYEDQWGKVNNTLAREAAMRVAFNTSTEQDKAIDYLTRSGLGFMYLYQSRWEGSSKWSVGFPGGKDGLAAFSDKLSSKGLHLALHTGSAMLKKNDTRWVTPVPDDRLAKWGQGTLAADISESSTTIHWTPDSDTVIPTISESLYGTKPPVYPRGWQYDWIRIGNELIHVGNFDTSVTTWVLTGCARGQHNTNPASHTSGDTVRGLVKGSYDNFAVDPDSSALQEIADRAADVINHCNVEYVVFDGLEGIGGDGRWGLGKFLATAYKGFDHYATASTSSGLAQYDWHATSYANVGEPMHHYPRSYVENYMFRNVTKAQDAFCPGAMGAYTFRVDGPAQHASTPDEWNWWLAKSAAYDALYFLDTDISNLDNHGQTHEILELCSKWSRARRRHVFTQSQKDQMKQYDMSYSLTSSDWDADNWEVSPTRIVPKFVQPADSVQVDNPFAAQPLRFELRVLGVFDYASASNVDLLPSVVSNFSIPADLSIVKNGNEWTFTTTGTGEAVQADWDRSMIDLSSKRGVGLYVTGDGNGGYFYIEYQDGDKVRHYVIPNDFAGRKYVEVPTYEVCDYLYLDDLYELWPHESSWHSTRMIFKYDKIVRVSYGFIDVAPGQTVSVTIEGAKALQENAASLDNLFLATGADVLSVTGSVASGNYLVYEGGSTATVLDANRHFVSTFPVSTYNWQKSSGVSEIFVNCSSTNKPWLKVLFKTLDTPFTVPNPVNADLNNDSRVDTDFTKFTVASGVCSPSRTAVMTGHFPAHYNIDGYFAWVHSNQRRNMPDWLSPKAPLLTRFLKDNGYATAHYGKWHLANDMIPDSPLPSEYGYDAYGAFNCTGEQMPVHEDARNAIAFMKKSHHRRKPFFINVWLHEPHTPFHTQPKYRWRFRGLEEADSIYASVSSLFTLQTFKY